MTPATPRAILVDLDDTILAAGQRPQVLLAIAQEFAAELSPHPPQAVADQLEAALTLFWSDPERHKVARFGIAEARRSVVRDAFAVLPPLTRELADRFAAQFTAAREAMTVCFPGACAPPPTTVSSWSFRIVSSTPSAGTPSITT